MSLHTKSFGKLPDNSVGTLFSLADQHGVTASVMNYGTTNTTIYAANSDNQLTSATTTPALS
ncbi:MAG: hypothetical protein ABSD58_06770 [Verrucomicrobiia bacterium]|jgi:hypothetical protein